MISQAQAGMLRELRASLPSGKVLAAVSGGPDSVALLHLLAEHLPASKLVVGHVNHRTRGRESDGDEGFVREMAKGLALPCLVARLKKTTRPSEASLREARYAALETMAKTAHCSRIAVAHTADDQAETVLLRIVRGTGVAGLKGMARERKLGRLLVVRPLLSIAREELLEYLKRHGTGFRLDRSNRDLGYARNRVRLEVLPELRKINPRVREALLRLSVLASKDEPWNSGGRTLSKTHVDALKRLVRQGRGEVRLPGNLLVARKPTRG